MDRAACDARRKALPITVFVQNHAVPLRGLRLCLMCRAQSSRAGARTARTVVLSTAIHVPARASQLPKIGSETMSFTVTTAISISTSAMPVR